jgi:hypothetical protein
MSNNLSTGNQEISLARKLAAKQLYYRTHLVEFLSNELKIATKEIGVELPFVPNPAQLPILRAAEAQLKQTGKIRQLIFKCRQAGLSTYSAGITWSRLSLFRGVYAFVVAQDRSTVEHVFAMTDLFRRRMASDLRRSLKYYTKGSEIVLGEGGEEDSLDSRLFVGEAKNISLGVGRTIHVLHGTEVARWPKSEPIKESLIPACSDAPGSVKIFESTAHFGKGSEWFRYQCEAAMAGKSEYEFFFVEWWRQMEYALPLKKGERLKLDSDERYFVKKLGMTLENIVWRRKKIGELEGDVESFKMSYPTTYEEGWILREMSAFPRDRLMELHSMIKPPIARYKFFPDPHGGKLIEHPEGELWVWHKPAKDGVYDIGADIAEGHDDGDWSVAEVIERATNVQCAEWRGKILPVDFADVLATIGKFYNTAQIGPEITGPGLSTCRALQERYPNIYLWRKQDSIAPKFTQLMGWKTQYDSKRLMVDLAHTKIYHRQVKIYSQVLWDELRYFARDYTETGMITFRAAQGHDDCVLAWVIALKISNDEDFSRYVVRSGAQVEKPKNLLEDAYCDSKWDDDRDGWDRDDSLKVELGSWR